MQKVARSALVMHRAEDMYSLVCDVAAYPRFLPWCEHAEVLSQSAHQQLARIGICHRGLRKSFTTRNRLQPFDSIEMQLAEGPFNELSGAWKFKSLREDACRVSLDLQFSASGVMRHALAPVFENIVATMVDSFVRRAEEIFRAPPANRIRVEIVYASPERQVSEQLTLAPPADIAAAIRASTLPAHVPEVDFANMPAGVFGMLRPPNWQLCDGDRVEIYRPLQMSPVEARRRRAKSPLQ